MRTTLRLLKPDELEASLTITMRVKEWRELQAQLVAAYPSWKLSSAISDVISKAEKIFYADEPDGEA